LGVSTADGRCSGRSRVDVSAGQWGCACLLPAGRGEDHRQHRSVVSIRAGALSALWRAPAWPKPGTLDDSRLRAVGVYARLDAPSRGRRRAMMLLVVGCSFRDTPVALRERLAFEGDKLTQALDTLTSRYGCEAVILSTCNRVELYLARVDPPVPMDGELVA